MSFKVDDKVRLRESVGPLQKESVGRIINIYPKFVYTVSVDFGSSGIGHFSGKDINYYLEKIEDNKNKSDKILRPYIHEGDDRDSILGNSKNLDALGDMLKMKAKLGSSFKATFYDGVNKPIDIEIDTEILGEE